MDLSGQSTQTKFVGKFPMRVTKTSDKPSKSGKAMWSAEFSVIGSAFKGYKVTEYFLHDSEIARTKLAKMASVLDMDLSNVDIENFRNKCFMVEVGQNKEGKAQLRDFEAYEQAEESSY
jgi:hypothetical protein